MSEIQPANTDAILGGQNPAPVDAAVLGGVAGAKQQIAKEWGLSEELVACLSETHKIFAFETVKTNDLGEVIKRTKKHAFYYTENLGNDVGIDMVYIPAGSFMMGTSEEESNKALDRRTIPLEKPQHLVNIPAFYMAKYPTTQEQYQAIMGENPSNFRGINLPVEQVTWKKAKEYCQNLINKTDKPYVLPSESQWEYACRSGTNTLFYFGDVITTDLANYNGKFSYERYPSGVNREQTTSVDTFPPNSFGLYDLHGNISQWCADTWHVNYEGAPTDERPWVDDLPSWSFGDYYYHVLRGGSWFVGLSGCHCANRTTGSQIPSIVGFRICCLAV
jgi:formylglycine-generating enzyme required for sulfatase activity